MRSGLEVANLPHALNARWSFATCVVMLSILVLAGCASGPGSKPGVSDFRDATSSLDPDAPALADEEAAESSQVVAEALAACESASVFWEQGDLDAALASLDLAYELLLQIPNDPSLIQQKEDLRHLISSRVVEIYGSRLTTAADLNSPIPVEVNQHVQREIARFTGPEKKFFLASYERSGLYRPMIVAKLKAAGLPEELSWLPLVESGFKTRAMSSARALGMWQFISSTGSRYGMARSRWIDERMDPEKSTDAAIEYLTDLHGMFGDWMLALAGYNCGENRVMSQIRRQQNDYLDQFWDVFGSLPSETARYVPRFLATLVIVNDPEKYGMELPQPLTPVASSALPVSRHVRLTDLDRVLGVDRGTLASLNPELRHGTTPDDAYELRVPAAAADGFGTKLAALPTYAPPAALTYARHRVRSGETLSRIARRYRTSVSAIVRANNLRSRHRISVGQRLKIPQRGGSSSVVAATPVAPGKSLVHTVRSGDSLWRLAAQYGTTVNRIKATNGLRSDQLAVGQRLKIESASQSKLRSYTVRSGDTLGRIAKNQRVPIDAILAANGLSRSSTIHPGQVIRVPD